MFGGELLVVLLSAVPLIENRGAMFAGFALGITDPAVYALGTLANIAAVPLCARLMRRIPFPLPIRHFGAKPLHHIPLLVALPYTGVNMASVLYFLPRLSSAKLQAVYLYLSAGIILRGMLTYLFFIGLLGFMNVTDVIAVLVLWYALYYLAGILRLKRQEK